VALIKRYVIFFLSLLFINILLFSATQSYAKDDVMGLGIGTRTCNDFIHQTVEITDDGSMTERALLKRLEYLQWANGFMTALNIRHYEKTNAFKKMNKFQMFNDLYNEIILACNFMEDENMENDFSIAAFLIFDSLEREN
jgi:hypothetical protein